MAPDPCVLKPSSATRAQASPLLVHFYGGSIIPERAASFDAVLFLSVLHHAANSTKNLLRQAASVARRYIVVLEDLDNGEPTIAARNFKHDPTGIFRTDARWKSLFLEACDGFSLLGDGLLGERTRSRRYMGKRFYVGVTGDEKRKFHKWYMLRRRS